MIKLLSNKWLSLFCTVINSAFVSIAWQQGDYVWTVLSFGFAVVCGYNFITAIKEDYYDQDGQ